ncbi:hypothetical protein ACFX13_016332 [Malus domestica]
MQEVEKDGKKEKVEVQVLKAKCNHCSSFFACDTSGGGTSTYIKHINKHCKSYQPTDELQKVLGSSGPSGDGNVKNMLVAKGWSQEESEEGIIEFIVLEEVPFSIVESEGFRRMMCKVQPRLHVPSRRTMLRGLFNMYDSMKNQLKKEIHNHRVSLTTDTWTSVQNLNYMVLTAHFVDDDWNMHKRILNFCLIPSHEGKEIGKMIEQCLDEWGIEKVMCISVDNASANKVAIEYVVRKMQKWPNSKMIMNGKFMHVRCLAHIINLVVKHGLKKLDTTVDALRNAVRFVRSSPRRLSYFKKCVENEKLDSKGLVVMDVPTRWNSTYMMLESCLKFKKAFERMTEDDEANIYTTYFSEKVFNDEGEEVAGKGRVGPPKEEDWDSAEVFVEFLKAFYLITLKVSASNYPTSNTAVHDVIVVENEIEKLFLPEYMQTGRTVELVLRDMAFNMRAKYRKYFGSIESLNQIFIVALVLDPRFKLRHYMHLCRKQLQLSEEEIEQKSNLVKTLLKAMCDEYAYQAFGSQTQQKGREDLVFDTSSSRVKESSSSVPTENPMIFSQIMDDWEKELEDTEDIALAHEVDRYLLDTVEKAQHGSQFDVLKWWKLKGRSTYPTLALIAKDVLPIQVSTVASESAFSGGKRLIHPCRSCLLPQTVECLRNWIKSEPIGIEYEASCAELEFYQECEEEYKRKRANTISTSSTISPSDPEIEAPQTTRTNKGKGISVIFSIQMNKL